MRLSVKTKLKECDLFYPPSLNPSHQGREVSGLYLSFIENGIIIFEWNATTPELFISQLSKFDPHQPRHQNGDH